MEKFIKKVKEFKQEKIAEGEIAPFFMVISNGEKDELMEKVLPLITKTVPVHSKNEAENETDRIANKIPGMIGMIDGVYILVDYHQQECYHVFDHLKPPASVVVCRKCNNQWPVR